MGFYILIIVIILLSLWATHFLIVSIYRLYANCIDLEKINKSLVRKNKSLIKKLQRQKLLH